MSCDIFYFIAFEVQWLIFSLLLLFQVSKSWKVLAEDEVLWHRLCLEEGYNNGASISDSPCWKSTLRDCRNTENVVKSNWKVSTMPLQTKKYFILKQKIYMTFISDKYLFLCSITNL